MLDDLIPLSITFPRYVQLQNSRLAFTYWTMAGLVLFSTVATFVLEEGYFMQRTPSGSVHFWPTDWNPSEEKSSAINAAEAEKDYCATPKKYEFCSDAECSWAAVDLKCMNLCTGSTAHDCLEPAERWSKTDSSVFFPTYFVETVYQRHQAGQAEQQNSPDQRQDEDVVTERSTKTRRRIVKGVQEMGISFQHNYLIYGPGAWGSSKPVRETGKSISTKTNYGNGILTILQDLDGNEIDRWQPGNNVNLRLEQILKAGKVSLDTIQTDLGSNFLDDAQIQEGILMRLAGADITLQLSYHNPASSSTPEWSGPVCYLSVHSTPVWTSNPVLHLVDHLGSQRFRYYQGLRIRFKTTGIFSWVSTENISNKLAQVLVFVAVVKQIIFYFTILCLGVVSHVYKGFVYQKVSLGKEACGIAARLAAFTSSFVNLKDAKDSISEERFLHRFQHIFKNNSELDDQEVKRFAHFVFARMAHDHEDGIDVQDFSHACSYGEALHFKTLVNLFDADRKKGFLERTFAGPTMRALFRSDYLFFAKRGLRPKTSSCDSLDENDKSRKSVSWPVVVQEPAQIHQNQISTDDLQLQIIGNRSSSSSHHTPQGASAPNTSKPHRNPIIGNDAERNCMEDLLDFSPMSGPMSNVEAVVRDGSFEADGKERRGNELNECVATDKPSERYQKMTVDDNLRGVLGENFPESSTNEFPSFCTAAQVVPQEKEDIAASEEKDADWNSASRVRSQQRLVLCGEGKGCLCEAEADQRLA